MNVNNSGSSLPYYYLFFKNPANNSQNYQSALLQIVTPVDAAASATKTTLSTSSTVSQTVNGETTVFITQPVTLSATSTKHAAAAASATGSPVSANNASPAGLSSGAKVGLGVGIPLGVIAAVGLGVFAVWSSWRHSRAAKRAGPGGGNYADQQTPYGAAQATYGAQTAYSPHDSVAKPGSFGYMPVNQKPTTSEAVGLYELPPDTVRPQPHELSSGETDATGHRGY